tara:strand:- start:181 stop:384 length:204 start_codon:yes stop_codon:yes gene_type:complete
MDMNSIGIKETVADKWDRARSLFLESLYKPDNELRACSHNQKCYNELMELREDIITVVKQLNNPHKD